MTYDPLVDLIHAAEEACTAYGLISKADALKNLQTVLRRNPIISLQLQRGMASELRQRTDFDDLVQAECVRLGRTKESQRS
jgi:predicted transcriptional regulator